MLQIPTKAEQLGQVLEDFKTKTAGQEPYFHTCFYVYDNATSF